MGHFIVYLFHYLIVRTFYTAAEQAGISPWLLAGIGVLGLLVWRGGKYIGKHN